MYGIFMKNYYENHNYAVEFNFIIKYAYIYKTLQNMQNKI